ncbi:thiamine diphosphokinase [Palleronia sediminis]|uniref:thiamine diphosphokinase n=1 Tax=Palleronia sediminis TaxID=2547833 RepID=UPI001F0DCF87|nr:thiamine diphosphokinase [Palleronia sediminis]
MSGTISDRFREAGPVTLLGGGPVSQGDLDWALARAPALYAADGGAEHALAANLVPRAVIGDLDSLTGTARARLPGRIIEVAEQETTDFEKCLQRIDAPLVVALGFIGARTDHTLAALAVTLRHGRPVLLLGPNDCGFACPREFGIDLPAGMRVSLFPFAPVTGRSEGLRWPIDGLVLSPLGRLGTSNEATGPVKIALDGGGVAMLLPTSARDAALAALSPTGCRAPRLPF